MSFGDDLEKFSVQAPKSSEKTIRGSVISLWGIIIKASPVKSGRFRGNWFATGAAPSTRVDYSRLDPTGSKSVMDATNKVLSLKSADAFNLTNNLPYARRLEEGWSDQAGAGWVRSNVTRFQRILEREARKNNK